MIQTTEYEIFKDIISNREVDDKHVRKLSRSIEENNLLHLNPIIVDHELRVVDGQHRLEAAKLLQVPIYYIQDNKVTRKAISKLNSNQKNWSTMDYINFYTVEKVVGFSEFSKFLNHNPHLSSSAAISLCAENHNRDILGIKNGFIDVSNITQAYELAEMLDLLNKKFQKDFVYDSKFPIAIDKVRQDRNFSFDTLITKILDNERAFVKCPTIKEYMAMIQEIYNYNLSKNKIYLT